MAGEEKANRVIEFIETLKLTEDFHGKPFVLRDWQKEIVSSIFGTLNPDGTRQYKKAYISIARKNAKSQLTAAMALYCLFAEPGYGKQIYTAAGEREQASIIYRAMRDMVLQDETLSRLTKPLDSVKRLVYLKKNSFAQSISSESYSKHGYNPSVVIYDEVHVAPNRDLWDVLKTGMGTRKEPLMIGISTSGFDRNSLCYELYDYGKKVNAGIIDDPTFYCKIFELDEKDDWKDEKNWYKANPALNDFRSLEEMRDEFRMAIQMPSYLNTFKRLYLNMWTQQSIKAIDMDLWNANGKEDVIEENLVGRKCYGGLDLASVSDFIAWVMIFPRDDDFEQIDVLARFWCPEKKAFDSSNRYKDQYQVWAREGCLRLTPGDATDYGFVKKCILEDAHKFNIEELNVDRLFQGQQLSSELMDEGLKVIAMGQGFIGMIAPCTEFERRLLTKKIHHGNNPVLTFCADNLMWEEGPAGHKPSKKDSQGKIDGIVALIMAIDRASRNGPITSVYDTRGLLQIS